MTSYDTATTKGYYRRVDDVLVTIEWFRTHFPQCAEDMGMCELHKEVCRLHRHEILTHDDIRSVTRADLLSWGVDEQIVDCLKPCHSHISQRLESLERRVVQQDQVIRSLTADLSHMKRTLAIHRQSTTSPSPTSS